MNNANNSDNSDVANNNDNNSNNNNNDNPWSLPPPSEAEADQKMIRS
jgi:hypothetical protein